MLPGLDGLSIVKTIRAAGVQTPVLFLTTLGGIDDRVEGLDAGGDDYLLKPFAFAELLARVNALSRRPPRAEVETTLRVADLEIDLLKRSVTRAGKKIELQPQELKLLEYLMRHAGRTVTRTMLLENVWEFHFDPQTTVVETHISRLRGKIDQGARKPGIKAVVPAIAGMTGMPLARFTAINVVSAVVWSAAHLVPGLSAGWATASYGKAEGWLDEAIEIAGVAIAIALIVWLARRIFVRRPVPKAFEAVTFRDR